MIEVLVIVGVEDPSMQIKYRQRWAASFLDRFNWVSQLKVKVLSSNLVGLSELSLHFHSPLWRWHS